MLRETPGRQSDRGDEREDRLLRLLERELVLLQEILKRMPPPPTYQPTTGIAVVRISP
jgi:hypothetical protein